MKRKAPLRLGKYSEGENTFDPVRKSIRGDNMTEKGKISNGVDGGLEGYYTV